MTKIPPSLQQFKDSRLVPRCKVLRLTREVAAFDRDIDIAMQMVVERAQAHNERRGLSLGAAPRASPAIH